MSRKAGTAAERDEDQALRLIYAVGRYDRAVLAALRRRLPALDLTVAEFTTLSVLRARSGLSNAQLARRALVTPQAMNQVLASLEDKGLVQRQASPGLDTRGHHRARGAELTAKGVKHGTLCDSLVDEIEDASFAALDPDGRAALAGMLRDATERLRTHLLSDAPGDGISGEAISGGLT